MRESPRPLPLFDRFGKRTAFAAAVLSAMVVAAACGSSGDDDDGTGATGDAGRDASTVPTPPGTQGDATLGDTGTPILRADSGPGTGDDDGSATDAGSSDATVDAAPPIPQEAGATCTSNDQCESLGCDDTGHCATVRSCTQQNGGRTCGPDGGDNCCTTIFVPIPDGGFDGGDAGSHISASYSLDKYSITAGRFRQFIESTDGGVRQYVDAHRPDWFDPGWESFLPIEMDDGTKVDPDAGHAFVGDAGRLGVYQQLGPLHYGTEGGGNEGCLTKEIGNARTYRLPDDVNASLFGDVQQYSQAELDPKPMQCANFFMFAAFCIWDGGRIPTLSEIDYAWDEGDPKTHQYPWGNAPEPAGWDYAFDTQADALAYGKSYNGYVYDAGAQDYANYEYNWWSPTTESCEDGGCDYSIFLAPPGRFPKGNGPFGHSDLVGNVYNVAMPAVADPDPTTLAAGIAKSGAFDLHKIPQTHPVAGLRGFDATNKYLAIGGRCAR